MSNLVFYVSQCPICDLGFIDQTIRDAHTIVIGKGHKESYQRHSVANKGYIRVNLGDFTKLTSLERRYALFTAAGEIVPMARLDQIESCGSIRELLARDLIIAIVSFSSAFARSKTSRTISLVPILMP